MKTKSRVRSLLSRRSVKGLLVAPILPLALAFVVGREKPRQPELNVWIGMRHASNASDVSYPAFTLTMSRKVTRADGETRQLSVVQRFQRPDRIYKLVQTFFQPDGAIARVETQFGLIGLGSFRLDEARRRLIFTGPQIEEAPADIEQFLRANPRFTREESLAGIRTLVWRRAGTDGSQDFVEEYRAPSLGGLLIKTIKVTARQRETFEPTAIQMGEPPSTLFFELSYPANYSSYARRIAEAGKRGDQETANAMRQLLERMRRMKP